MTFNLEVLLIGCDYELFCLLQSAANMKSVNYKTDLVKLVLLFNLPLSLQTFCVLTVCVSAHTIYCYLSKLIS